jgi:hypothetical protein
MTMKFLCLAYGDARDWNALNKNKQDEMLAEDQALRNRGALMAAVGSDVTKLRAWEGKPEVAAGAFAQSSVSLAGFSVVDAESIDDVVQLVCRTPCARAKGWIEIRPILAINEYRMGPK